MTGLVLQAGSTGLGEGGLPSVFPVRQVAAIDAAVERWTDRRRRGWLDATAHLLSSGADRSKLWVAIAGGRAIADDGRGRTAAARALATVAVESAVIHVVVKRIGGRGRPVNQVSLRFGARRPGNAAFPSGHSASAATAAVLLAEGMAGWGPVLGVLAAAVGWSRVQTGLHHFSDVLGGLAIGTAVALMVRRIFPLDS
jgi:membrane-associated phospholipid phosphatase